MKDRIFNAFDQIHAEEALIEKTLEGMYSYNEKKERRAFFSRRTMPLALSLVLMLCIGITGWQVYFTQSFALTVDVNPSIEMTVNRFDRVISTKGFNQEGLEIISSVKVKHMNYVSAVDCLLEEEQASGYLEEEGEVLIAVSCPKKEKAEQVVECIDTMQAEKPQHVQVIQPKKTAIVEAEKEDMSFGKYQAYLDIHEVNPEVTVETVKEMSVQDIKTIMSGDAETQAGTVDSSASASKEPAFDGSNAATQSSVSPTSTTNPDSTNTDNSTAGNTNNKKPADGAPKDKDSVSEKKPVDSAGKDNTGKDNAGKDKNVLSNNTTSESLTKEKQLIIEKKLLEIPSVLPGKVPDKLPASQTKGVEKLKCIEPLAVSEAPAEL